MRLAGGRFNEGRYGRNSSDPSNDEVSPTLDTKSKIDIPERRDEFGGVQSIGLRRF